MKVLIELVSDNGTNISTLTTAPSTPADRSTPSPTVANHFDSHMELIFSCLHSVDSQDWQWWLGRLTFIKRLFQEHQSMTVLGSETQINMASTLPVSANSDVDLKQFLNSLGENISTSVLLSPKTTKRLRFLAEFAAAALSCSHTKVHKDALSLLVKCISISSQDNNVYPIIKDIVYGLNSNHQSKLHRHLSSESQREQEDILNILEEHGENAEGMFLCKNDIISKYNFVHLNQFKVYTQ